MSLLPICSFIAAACASFEAHDTSIDLILLDSTIWFMILIPLQEGKGAGTREALHLWECTQRGLRQYAGGNVWGSHRWEAVLRAGIYQTHKRHKIQQVLGVILVLSMQAWYTWTEAGKQHRFSLEDMSIFQKSSKTCSSRIAAMWLWPLDHEQKHTRGCLVLSKVHAWFLRQEWRGELVLAHGHGKATHIVDNSYLLLFCLTKNCVKNWTVVSLNS